MYDYTLSKTIDNDVFIAACRKIEKYFGIDYIKPLIDVDGSLIAIYTVDGNNIRIDLDVFIDAVFVTSDIDLTGIL